MKNDSTTTFLNFVLAALVMLAVMFALLTIWRTHDWRQLNPKVQIQAQQFQVVAARAQALLQDTMTYHATARSPELAQIIQSAQTPAPAAK